MVEDDDAPKKKLRYEIGQPLDLLSVEEINETIATLREEIERLEAAGAQKSSHLSAAEALFSKS